MERNTYFYFMTIRHTCQIVLCVHIVRYFYLSMYKLTYQPIEQLTSSTVYQLRILIFLVEFLSNYNFNIHAFYTDTYQMTLILKCMKKPNFISQ